MGGAYSVKSGECREEKDYPYWSRRAIPKPILVQIALAVSKSAKYPEIKNKYDSLKNDAAARKQRLQLPGDF